MLNDSSHSSTKSVIAGCGLLAVTAVLAVIVYTTHGPTGFDSSVWSWLIDHRSGPSTTIAEFVSTVMSPVATVLIALVVGVVLWRRDRNLERGAILVGTVIGADAVTEVLKVAVHRTRPPMSWQLETHEAAGSFPSGHTTGAAALAFGLAVLLLPRATAAVRVVIASCAALVAVAVAVSRIYLGMHWATDVIAALLIGLAAALIVPILVRALMPYVESSWARIRHSPTASEAIPAGRHRATQPDEARR